MLYKLLSYIFPINLYKTDSEISGSLEISLHNGKMLLDSQNTNYSYGSLQRILRFGLQKIGFKKICSMQNILILGVAAGSVIKTLVDEIGFLNKIKGVEIDPEVIEMANKHFGLSKIKNLEIIIEDAQQFVKTEKTKYELIVIDIFQDAVMPSFLFERQFAENINILLSTNGIIIFNTMKINSKETSNIVFFQEHFNLISSYVLEKHNTMFIFEKKTI